MRENYHGQPNVISKCRPKFSPWSQTVIKSSGWSFICYSSFLLPPAHIHILLNSQDLGLKLKQKKWIYSQHYFIFSFGVFTGHVDDMPPHEDLFRASLSAMSLPSLQSTYRWHMAECLSGHPPKGASALPWGVPMPCKKYYRKKITHENSQKPWGAGNWSSLKITGWG